jgi:hypothetical protein
MKTVDVRGLQHHLGRYLDEEMLPEGPVEESAADRIYKERGD